jgi:hypothetical protein
MRKRLITSTAETVRPHDESWLDLERAAVVEVTSEKKDFRSSLRWSWEKRGAGARASRELRRFGWSSISRKG